MSDFLPSVGPDTLPDSPEASTGIVGTWLDGLPEWPDQRRTVERAYLGTLMGWKPDLARPTVQVPDEWLTAFGRAARAALRAAKPWPPYPSLYLISTLRDSFKPEFVVDEVAAYCSAALPWQALDEVAERLRAVYAVQQRNEKVAKRRRLVEEMLPLCHVSEAIAEKCKELEGLC